MMVPQPVSVTLPEIIYRVPVRFWISILGKPFTRLESAWFLSFRMPKKNVMYASAVNTVQGVLQWNRQTSPACSGDYSEQKVSYKPWVN
jgi:hypothetical protein